MWNAFSMRWLTSGLFRLAVLVLLAVLVFQLLARSFVAPSGGPGIITRLLKSVSGRTTEVFVSASDNPVDAGQNVTFTADVTDSAEGSATPAGRIKFMDGSHVIGQRPLRDGRASLETATLALGIHHITARFQPAAGGRLIGTDGILVLHVVEPDSDTGPITEPPGPEPPVEKDAGKRRTPREKGDGSGGFDGETDPPPRPRWPDNVIGTWGRSKGGREPLAEHTVEFRSDGSGKIHWNARRTDQIAYTYEPGAEGLGRLRIYKPNGRTGQNDFLEGGEVRWTRGGNHFMFTIEETSDGIHREGWQYSFVRKPNAPRRR